MIFTNSNVFDTSLAYQSQSIVIKKQFFEKAMCEVKECDLNQPDWKLSKSAKELAKKTFEEFYEKMKSDFNNPDYAFWIKVSLEAERLKFIPELLAKINDVTQKNE